MRTKIETLLKEILPSKTYINVRDRMSIFKEPQISIQIAVSDYEINRVQGQRVQLVSMLLDLNTMELKPQVFGGNGGQSVYRKPNMLDSKEKYLAMKGIKIPFRTPKPEEKFVLAAIKRFAENWLDTIKENKEVLMYQQYVNYDEFLNS